MISFEFLITSFLVVLAPGTGVVYTVSTGLVQGRKASVFAALGCTAGIIPHLLATVLGLAAVMHTSALAFSMVKYAGVAYLFYVAYATFKDKSTFVIDSSVAQTPPAVLIRRAFLMNILNPKFVNPVEYLPMVHLLVLSAVFMLMTFVVFVAYGFLAHAFRRLVVESTAAQTMLRYGFSAAFAGLGAKLAFTEK
jgi:threonine/homoserine/homoserine lactone efflux protein